MVVRPLRRLKQTEVKLTTHQWPSIDPYRMSEFAKRAITGAAYVTLTLGAAWAGPVTTTLLFLPVCLLAAREMYRLTARSSVPHTATYPVLAAAVVYVILALISIVP